MTILLSIFYLIVFVIGFALLAVIFVIFSAIYAAVGWLVIIIWAILGFPKNHELYDPAVIALCNYALIFSLAFICFAIVNRALWLNVLAQLVPAPMRHKASGQIDLSTLAKRSSSKNPVSYFGMKFDAWRNRKAAADLRVETNFYDAQTDLHRAAQDYNRAKMRAEEAERARRRNG